MGHDGTTGITLVQRNSSRRSSERSSERSSGGGSLISASFVNAAVWAVIRATDGADSAVVGSSTSGSGGGVVGF